MRDLTKKIETASNLAIIVVAVLLAALLIKSYLLPGPKQSPSGNSSAAQKLPAKGDAIKLSEVDWQKNQKTLLLVLSDTCRFCTQSAPFYQRLVKDHGEAHLITLLPQSVDAGKSYLEKLGVDITDVRQVSLGSLGVNVTPALILVDDSGKVSEVWAGALPADKEEEVISRLRPERARR